MSTAPDILLSVIAPLEPGADTNIEDFVARTADVLRSVVAHHEIILVDDGATDGTAQRIQRLLTEHDFVRFVRLSRHFGEETAIAAGLDAAIGDFVIVMLPQFDPPELIPRFLDRARSEADIVYGVRLHREQEPWWYRLGARAFYWYMNAVLRSGLPENSTQFRCMSRQVVNAITSIRDPDRYLRLLTSYVGFTKVGLPYVPLTASGRAAVRPQGEAVNLAVALIVEHTSQPLRLSCWGAVGVALLYVLGGLVMTGRGLPGADVHVAIAGALLVVTVVLAMLGEYVAILMRRGRARPSYYVREEESSAVMLREPRHNVVHDTLLEESTTPELR